jgi:hypothetical protein
LRRREMRRCGLPAGVAIGTTELLSPQGELARGVAPGPRRL